jgi:hypothetical protein
MINGRLIKTIDEGKIYPSLQDAELHPLGDLIERKPSQEDRLSYPVVIDGTFPF